MSFPYKAYCGSVVWFLPFFVCLYIWGGGVCWRFLGWFFKRILYFWMVIEVCHQNLASLRKEAEHMLKCKCEESLGWRSSFHKPCTESKLQTPVLFNFYFIVCLFECPALRGEHLCVSFHILRGSDWKRWSMVGCTSHSAPSLRRRESRLLARTSIITVVTCSLLQV